MKKLFILMVVALMTTSIFVGCEAKEEAVMESSISAKVAVNVSGEVVEVDGNKVKLDNGTWILITDETVFADDPDNGVEAVDSTMQVGNFIQGYSNDPEADEVIMMQIYNNSAMTKPSMKVAVNITGVITEIEGNKVKLDNGMWVIINEDTKFSDDPDNGSKPVNSELKVGNHIVGFTLDDTSASQVTAYSIYSNAPKK